MKFNPVFYPWELNLYPALALVTSRASLFSVRQHSIALLHAGIRALSHLAQPQLSPRGCFTRNLFLIRHSAPPPVIKDPINGAGKKVKHLNNGDSCFAPFKKIHSYCYQPRTVLQTGASFRPCHFWQFDKERAKKEANREWQPYLIIRTHPRFYYMLNGKIKSRRGS